jgi:predicted P-loop ATPase
MEKCFGTALTASPEHARLLFRKWIVGTAARTIHPGKSLDGCLVLQGETGIGKTQFFRQILPSPFDGRTGEIYCDIKNPNKFVEALLGKTVACFDELSVLEHAKTLETFKQLLTSQFIDVRLAWARTVRRFNMRVGLGGTSNKTKFITDPSLSRRLWVIELNPSQRLDFDYLSANKEALWKEAVYFAEQGESCIMTPEEQKMIEEYNAKFMA